MRMTVIGTGSFELFITATLSSPFNLLDKTALMTANHSPNKPTSHLDHPAAEEDIVFYDGMSDEELDLLLQASLGDEDELALGTDVDINTDTNATAAHNGSDSQQTIAASSVADIASQRQSMQSGHHDLTTATLNETNNDKNSKNNSDANASDTNASDTNASDEKDSLEVFDFDDLIFDQESTNSAATQPTHQAADPLVAQTLDSQVDLGDSLPLAPTQPSVQDSTAEPMTIDDDFFSLDSDLTNEPTNQQESVADSAIDRLTIRPDPQALQSATAATALPPTVAAANAPSSQTAANQSISSRQSQNGGPSTLIDNETGGTRGDKEEAEPVKTPMALSDSAELQHISEQVSSEMLQLKTHLHLLTLQFHELGNISARLMKHLRSLQSDCVDDFSITYEQMLELRSHLVATKQQAGTMPSLLDLAEEALESEMYVAQLRNKR